MPGRRQHERVTKRKREDEDDDFQLPGNPSEIAQLAKRPRTTSQATVPVSDMAVASTSKTTIVPHRVFSVYRQMLLDRPEGIAFLFSPRFFETLQATAENVADEYMITLEEAIEEFRRLVAMKTFADDQYATKISPSPLSKSHNLRFHFHSMQDY